MARELLFAVLCAWVVAPLSAAGALAARARRPAERDTHAMTGRALEAEALWQLARPLVPAALALVGLVGWALQEPDNAEMPPWPALVWALLPALVWGRALLRAARALTLRVAGPATVGLFRPRIVLEPAFAASLEPKVKEAVLAHERAHARHRDPLRLWLAQIATDVQWPIRGAEARLEAFRAALELARDEEARAEVDGIDLATAVLAAARCGGHQPLAVAGISAPGAALRLRVERLLAPVPAAASAPRNKLWWVLLPAAATVALALGLHFGEAAIQWALS